MMLSNCCGYPPLPDTDLCSHCLEHADFIEEEEDMEIWDDETNTWWEN